MRKRRAADDRSGRDRDAGGWLGVPLALAARIGWSARDALAFAIGAAGAVAVVVNALFLQSGPHPAPLFKASLLPLTEATHSVPVVVPRPRPSEAGPPRAEAPKSAAAPTSAGRGDGIADLLSTRRLIALQRALAQYGYGQIKPTGVVDADTRAAIEKFERERKLPITGQPSERVARELSGLTGRPLD